MRAALIAVLLLVAPPAGAVPTIGSGYDRLIVFGDSLSDVGNVDDATFGLVPGGDYFDGRFSNGPVHVEHLSAGLGLGTVVHSRDGGLNFAHGGALTTGTGFPNNLFVRDLDDQVDRFLDDDGPDAGDLFVVYVGGNDVAGLADDGGGDATAPAGRVVDELARLYDAGARDFLVPNLPPLGLTPRFAGDPLATSLTLDFNAALADGLSAFGAGRPDAGVFGLDVAGLFADVVADPSAFGLVNVTDPALDAPGADPSAYLFWDDFHPTAAGHRLLGRAALAAVPHPLESRPRDEDFRRPTPRVGGPGLVPAAVPEPSAATLTFAIVALACRRRC